MKTIKCYPSRKNHIETKKIKHVNVKNKTHFKLIEECDFIIDWANQEDIDTQRTLTFLESYIEKKI